MMTWPVCRTFAGDTVTVGFVWEHVGARRRSRRKSFNRVSKN